jgi:hypothetical protein
MYRTALGVAHDDFLAIFVIATLTKYELKNCKEEKIVTDALGTMSISHIAGTTNGTVRSSGLKFTSPSPFGTLTCVTASGEGTDLGTLTGVKSGQASIDINATLNCGLITAKMTGTSTIASPEGLGVIE